MTAITAPPPGRNRHCLQCFTGRNEASPPPWHARYCDRDLRFGLVSLTLTPLMTARLLKERGPGFKQTWMEKVFGSAEKRVLAVYGRSLWWFLKHRWVSAVVRPRHPGRRRRG